MKVIDLYAKIANGEELPLKIKVKGYEYRKSNGQFWCDETEMYLMDNCTSIYELNDEVEIIEEDKKIEKIKIDDELVDEKTVLTDIGLQRNLIKLTNKINEIIDKLNGD